MRSACSAMMPRKRSRASASSRAGPRRVSMNPAIPRDRRLELMAGIGNEIGPHALGAPECRGVVQHDQHQRAIGRSPRQATGMGDDIEFRRARQHDLDRDLVGPDEVAVGRVEQRIDRRQQLGMAQRRRQVAIRAHGAQQRHRRAIGAHDAALAVDRDQRVGQAVDNGLRGGREIVDRGALAAPAGRQRRSRGGEFLGGRRERQTRHHRLLLVRQFTDEAGEARQRAEIALHQDGGDDRDAGKGEQGRAAGQITRPMKATQGGS